MNVPTALVVIDILSFTLNFMGEEKDMLYGAKESRELN